MLGMGRAAEGRLPGVGERMRTVLGLLGLICIGGAALLPAALAQSTSVAPQASRAAADTKITPTAGAPVRNGRKARRKGGVPEQAATRAPPPSRQSCLDLWEPATHMTRRQWARACRGLDERLASVTLR
jgi:hypothetical protein